MSSQRQVDVVAMGAGAGGLFTAARLAHRGYRTLVVEALDKVGAPSEIREPKPPILYRIAGKDVDVTGGGWGSSAAS